MLLSLVVDCRLTGCRCCLLLLMTVDVVCCCCCFLCFRWRRCLLLVAGCCWSLLMPAVKVFAVVIISGFSCVRRLVFDILRRCVWRLLVAVVASWSLVCVRVVVVGC